MIPLTGWGETLGERQHLRSNPPYLQIRTTTGSRLEEPVRDTSGSFSVLTEEEIEVQNPITAPEVLRDMPGVRLRESGTLGESAVLSLRGAEPSQTLIMIEGVRVNEPYRGRFDIGNFYMDEIGQVEIVRGAQSALYGSDAIGGVVNLRTRRPRKPFELTLLGEIGTEETYRAGLSFGGVKPWVEYSITLSGVQTEGQFEHDDYQGGNIAGSVKFPLSVSGQIDYIFRFQDDHKDLGIDFVSLTSTSVRAFIDGNSNLDKSFLFQSIQFREKISRWLGLNWKASFIDTALDWDNPSDPVNMTPYFEDTHTQTLILDFQQNLFVTSFDTFTFGLEWRKESVETDINFMGIPLNLDDRRWNTGFYFQNLLKWDDRLVFQGGVRIDENSDFETFVNPKVSAAYTVEVTETKIRGGWGKGFSGPTFQRILLKEFQNQMFSVPGNPKLRPEKAESWEAGLQQPFFGNLLLLDAVFFRIDYKDLIQPGPIGVDNIGRARTEGIETFLKIEPFESFSFQGSFTYYLESKDRNSDEALPFRPEKRWNLKGVYSPAIDLVFNLDVNIVSSQPLTPGTDFTLVDGTVLRGRSPGYTLVDISATYYLLGGFKGVREARLFVKFRNLFDQDYESVPGFPAPGFGASGGMIFYF